MVQPVRLVLSIAILCLSISCARRPSSRGLTCAEAALVVNGQVASDPFGVDVAALATGGSGAASDPWTGWDATVWQPATTYRFRSGYYSYSSMLNLAVNSQGTSLQGSRFIGEAGTVLQYTGSANAVEFDAGTAPAALVWDLGFENFMVDGGSSAINGIHVRSLHHSHFRNIRVRNVASAGLFTEFSVANTYDNFVVTVNEVYPNRATYGIRLGRRAPGEDTTASTFITPIIEGVGSTGIWVEYGDYNTFIGGTSEGNGRGIQIDARSTNNKFINVDLEANKHEHLLIAGRQNHFDMVNADEPGNVHVSESARDTYFAGGQYYTIAIDAGAQRTRIFGAQIAKLTDYGTPRALSDTIPAVAAKENISGIALDALDQLRGTYSFSSVAQDLTTTVLSTATWRAVFVGVFNNDCEGTLLPQSPLFTEVTSDSPTVTVGSVTLHLQLSGGILQAYTTSQCEGWPTRDILFSGMIFVTPNSFGHAGASSASYKGSVTIGSTDGATLMKSTPPNGTLFYCTDCAIDASCSSGGTGALAKRLNGVWVCN
jgi:hypothetical protein